MEFWISVIVYLFTAMASIVVEIKVWAAPAVVIVMAIVIWIFTFQVYFYITELSAEISFLKIAAD